MGYSIAIVDGILAPFIPSNAALSGGTVYPIVTNIAPMFDSLPDKNPRRIGAYLIWVGLASSCVTSSIFLTGQAPNPLALTLISKSGVAVPDWFGWFLANLPIGILLFILTPLLAFWFYPPEIKGSQEIAQWARGEYEKLGSMSKEQIYMVIIALLGLTLWIGSSAFKINATTTALLMIVLMVATRVIEWKDFLHNTTAWNTLVCHLGRHGRWAEKCRIPIMACHLFWQHTLRHEFHHGGFSASGALLLTALFLRFGHGLRLRHHGDFCDHCAGYPRYRHCQNDAPVVSANGLYGGDHTVRHRLLSAIFRKPLYSRSAILPLGSDLWRHLPGCVYVDRYPVA